MPRSIPALVKPKLLVWARESAGLSLVQAAERTKFEVERLKAWESEEADTSPSIAQLRKLGEAYKRPIAVFFLSEPPQGFAAHREFRRLAGILPGKESPELLLALRWAVFRREAAMELHRLVGEAPHRIRTALHPGMDVEEAGHHIRELLGVAWRAQTDWASAYEALNTWRSAMEAKGVLVFQSSGVKMEEMRGTCIPDQPLPVILLNSKDAPHGRIFSLLHEFAHILLHAGGHQTSRMVGSRSPEEQPLEVAANAFAAAALLPANSFAATAEQYSGAAEGDDDALRRLAQKVKVSPEVILRRLVTLRKAPEGTYRRKRDAWGATLWYVRGSVGGPVPMEVRTIASDGRGYTRLVMNAYDQRLISTNAASDYLGVKPRHFTNIRRELSPRPSMVGA
jgi:Zn-dependent peptidase ImmA (M78 family)/transcriptional regulator with XRE-family HTH domain